MERYFMTIPEAVQLVLQAAVLGKGGEVFLLDMGQPVRILDLAEDVIRLSGFIPGVDIKIEFTGIRPGEKLHEELVAKCEILSKTGHEKVFLLNTRVKTTLDRISLEYLIQLVASDASPNEFRNALRKVIAEYTGQLPMSFETTSLEPRERGRA
jgi:FlaA1/EpsC-like NDP-sugar epimerase